MDRDSDPESPVPPRVLDDGWPVPTPAKPERSERVVRDLTSAVLATQGDIHRLEARFDKAEEIAARKYLNVMEAIALVSSGLQRNAEADAAADAFFKMRIDRAREELDDMSAHVGEVREKLQTHGDLVERLAEEHAGTKALALAANARSRRALRNRRWKIAGLGGLITALIPVIVKLLEHAF